MKNLVARVSLILCVVVALVTASTSSSCRSNERLINTTTKPGPYGSEEHLTRALAIARLVGTIHDRLEAAGVCYFATGRTLEGVWRHASTLPHQTSSADLAVLDTQFAAARLVSLPPLFVFLLSLYRVTFRSRRPHCSTNSNFKDGKIFGCFPQSVKFL